MQDIVRANPCSGGYIYALETRGLVSMQDIKAITALLNDQPETVLFSTWLEIVTAKYTTIEQFPASFFLDHGPSPYKGFKITVWGLRLRNTLAYRQLWTRYAIWCVRQAVGDDNDSTALLDTLNLHLHKEISDIKLTEAFNNYLAQWDYDEFGVASYNSFLIIKKLFPLYSSASYFFYNHLESVLGECLKGTSTEYISVKLKQLLDADGWVD
ncbi:hypothetical protein [Dickeya phage Amaethon]|nr:hypothetical protein [Dickeya phage Amaethon]